MEVVLVRHAKAQDRIKALLKNISDADRPLTKKGILKFSDFVETHKRVFADTDIFIQSEFLRSKQTLDLILKICGRAQSEKLTLKKITPEDSPENLSKWLSPRKERKIVIVSHEPLISNFLDLVLNHGAKVWAGEKIKKGSIVSLVRDSKGRYKLKKIIHPESNQVKNQLES